MTRKDSGPAFPNEPYIGATGFSNAGHEGMSLRDWFAGMAMNWNIQHWTGTPEKLAKTAYEIADAVLEEREK